MTSSPPLPQAARAAVLLDAWHRVARVLDELGIHGTEKRAAIGAAILDAPAPRYGVQSIRVSGWHENEKREAWGK